MSPRPEAPRTREVATGDAELLAGIASGDLGALGVLYDRYRRDVRRVLHRMMISPADSEDLVQATFMKLPALAVSFDGRESARGWLAGIAVRLALRHRRSVGRLLRMLTASHVSTMDEGSSDPESNAASREEWKVFEKALAGLGDKKRAMFVLIELEGESAVDAARALGVPVATARTRLFHARLELREAMKRGGVW